MIKKTNPNNNVEMDDLNLLVHNNVQLKPTQEINGTQESFNAEAEGPNKEKPYPIRNFFKELKRVIWPTSKKNYKYFFWIFMFIISLVVFFALISWGATELVKLIGAK